MKSFEILESLCYSNSLSKNYTTCIKYLSKNCTILIKSLNWDIDSVCKYQSSKSFHNEVFGLGGYDMKRIWTSGLAVVIILSAVAFNIPSLKIFVNEEKFVEVTTDKYCYESGEQVIIALINVGSEIVSLGYAYTVIIYDALREIVLGVTFDEINVVEIPPSKNINYIWDQKNSAGVQVPSDNYTAWMGNENGWVGDSSKPIYVGEIGDTSEFWIGDCPSDPIADAGPDQAVNEGEEVLFDGSSSTSGENEWDIQTVGSADDIGVFTSIAVDSSGYARMNYSDKTNSDLKYAKQVGDGGQITSYEWDFTSDSIYDYIEIIDNAPDGAFDGKTIYTYGDNAVYTATLRITTEMGITDTDSCNITVNNIAPSISEIFAYLSADITLRLAGEKWHKATIYLYEDDVEIWSASVIRYPGSPDNQSATIEDIFLDLTKEYIAKVVYTPADDPANGQPNGGSPAWIILTFEDGSEEWIHHTFNVQHEDAWLWEANINQNLTGHEIIFEGSAIDLGSDDLMFNWSFSSLMTYYNDGTGSDPYPSPDGIFPFEATDIVRFLYAGSIAISLTVWDDDGGPITATILLA